MKIGLISDTHGYYDPQIEKYFSSCDEIWHAGDIGEGTIIGQLQQIAPTLAVFGNIDTIACQELYPEDLHFEREGFQILMSHIGGKPPSYNPRIRKIIKAKAPDIFICGHSHILRVIKDPKIDNLLYLNPGAAGRQGFHQMRTLLRFELNNKKISSMEVIELGKRGAIS
jgi:hypothetical protein